MIESPAEKIELHRRIAFNQATTLRSPCNSVAAAPPHLGTRACSHSNCRTKASRTASSSCARRRPLLPFVPTDASCSAGEEHQFLPLALSSMQSSPGLDAEAAVSGSPRTPEPQGLQLAERGHGSTHPTHCWPAMRACLQVVRNVMSDTLRAQERGSGKRRLTQGWSIPPMCCKICETAGCQSRRSRY